MSHPQPSGNAFVCLILASWHSFVWSRVNVSCSESMGNVEARYLSNQDRSQFVISGGYIAWQYACSAKISAVFIFENALVNFQAVARDVTVLQSESIALLHRPTMPE